MNLSELKAKYKISKLYAYRQEVDSKSSNIFFGWENADKLDLSEKIVLSTASQSKKLTEKEAEWSKSEGITAASLGDYDRFFRAALSVSPADFLDKWDGKTKELELKRKSSNPAYREGEGDFLIALARFILTKKKFSKFGRVYKVISLSDSDGSDDVFGQEQKQN